MALQEVLEFIKAELVAISFPVAQLPGTSLSTVGGVYPRCGRPEATIGNLI